MKRLAWLLLSLSAAAAHAQPVDAIQRLVAGEAVLHSGRARVEVEVGRIDPQLQLAPCGNVEPFLPANARLWGRAHVGLRCTDAGPQAARWKIYVPVTVRVYGPALVAARPIAPGQPFAGDDLASAEVEWTREAQGVATDREQLAGRVTGRAIPIGQPIPLAALRAAAVVGAGDSVRVIGKGAGFSIAAQAVALNSAADGEAVRVRLESGRIVSATARAGRLVELTF